MQQLTDKHTVYYNRPIGKGGYASVLKGKAENMDTAVKRLCYTTYGLDNKPVVNERIKSVARKEIRTFEKLRAKPQHRNIVRFLDSVDISGSYFLILEYCDLGNLETYMAKKAPGLSNKINIMEQCARGISFLHNEFKPPIVHGDIKPSNVLVKLESGEEVAKISDLSASSGGVIFGTLAYLPPEAYDNDSRNYASIASDIYSFGLMVLTILQHVKDRSMIPRTASPHHFESIGMALSSKEEHVQLFDDSFGNNCNTLMNVKMLVNKMVLETESQRLSIAEFSSALNDKKIADSSSSVMWKADLIKRNLDDKKVFHFLNDAKHHNQSSMCVNIDLSYNHLNKFPHFTHYQQFQSLSNVCLSNNDIQNFDIQYVPSGVVTLDLSYNRLEEFSTPLQIQNVLKNLDISNNNIVKIWNLPQSLETINFENNPLQIMDEKGFPTSGVFDLLIECNLLQTSTLEIPSQHTIKLGYHSLKQFFSERRCFHNSLHKIMLLGTSGSGITSLAKSIVKGCPYLVPAPERQNFPEIHIWKMDDGNQIEIYDQCKFDPYSNCSPVFINSHNTVFILHNADDNSPTSEDDTLSLLQCTIEQNSNCNIHFVLTNIDKLTEIEKDEFQKHFTTKVYDFLNAESQSLQADEKKSDDNYEIAKNKLTPTGVEKLKKSIKFFSVSSATYIGMPELKQYINDYLTKRFIITDPSVLREFHCFLSEFEGLFVTRIHLEKELINRLTDTKSCEKYPYLKKELWLNAKEKSRKRINRQKINAYLRDLHKCGLLIWMENMNAWAPKIFHNINSIRKFIFFIYFDAYNPKSVINSNVECIYSEYDLLLMNHLREKAMVIKSEILMDMWQSDDQQLTKNEMNNLCNLLPDLNFFLTYGEENELCYFPFAASKTTAPDNINLANPMIFDRHTLSLLLECEFCSVVPYSLVHVMVADLLRNADAVNPLADKYTWGNGVIALIDTAECMVFKKDVKTLTCCVRSPVEDLGKAWKNMATFHQSLTSNLVKLGKDPKFTYLVCSQCVASKKQSPFRRPACEVFKEQNKKKRKIVCNICDDVVLESLVAPIATESSTYKDEVDKILKYFASLEGCGSLEPSVQNQRYFGEGGTVSENRSLLTIKASVKELTKSIISIMLAPPVIEALDQYCLSAPQKEKLYEKSLEDQAEYLIKNMLLRGDDKVLKKFKEALTTSEYHTNDTVLTILMELEKDCEVNISEHVKAKRKLPTKIIETLLTKEATEYLLQKHDKFCAVINLNSLKEYLISSRALHKWHTDTMVHHDYSQIETLKFLFDSVLLRGTYDTVTGFQKALETCGDHNLAQYLENIPRSNGSIDMEEDL